MRDAEHRADQCKYQLVAAVREAFTTPMEPEDLFEVSRDLDEVLNGAKNTVREAQAIDVPVNGQLGKLADLISVQGNPIDQIRNMRRVRFIMKDGVRHDTLSWK